MGSGYGIAEQTFLEIQRQVLMLSVHEQTGCKEQKGMNA